MLAARLCVCGGASSKSAMYMKTPATTVRTTPTAVSEPALASTACDTSAPNGKAHEMATTAYVSIRGESAPRRAIATVNAATS